MIKITAVCDEELRKDADYEPSMEDTIECEGFALMYFTKDNVGTLSIGHRSVNGWLTLFEAQSGCVKEIIRAYELHKQLEEIESK